MRATFICDHLAALRTDTDLFFDIHTVNISLDKICEGQIDLGFDLPTPKKLSADTLSSPLSPSSCSEIQKTNYKSTSENVADKNKNKQRGKRG